MVSTDRPSRRLPASLLAATVFVLCVLVALGARSGVHGSLRTGKLAVRTTTTAPVHRTRGSSSFSVSLPQWIGWAAAGLVAAFLLALIIWHLAPLGFAGFGRGRAGAEADELGEFGPAPTVEDAETGARQAALRDAVLRSLDEVRRDPDARRAIIGAYRLMEAALARTGLPRAHAEAPREYLARALSSLDVGPAAPRRLTILFERARFDDADLDLSLRDEAVQALLELQRAL